MQIEHERHAQDDRRSRRQFLLGATTIFGVAGLGLAAWPMVESLQPAADTPGTVDVDLTGIARGTRVSITWRRWPVVVAHRTGWEVAAARRDEAKYRYDFTPDRERTIRPEWLVVVAFCQHYHGFNRGSPLGQRAGRGRWGGWRCQECKAEYDTSGRHRAGPAYGDLWVPPHEFVTDDLLRIG